MWKYFVKENFSNNKLSPPTLIHNPLGCLWHFNTKDFSLHALIVCLDSSAQISSMFNLSSNRFITYVTWSVVDFAKFTFVWLVTEHGPFSQPLCMDVRSLS